MTNMFVTCSIGQCHDHDHDHDHDQAAARYGVPLHLLFQPEDLAVQAHVYKWITDGYDQNDDEDDDAERGGE